MIKNFMIRKIVAGGIVGLIAVPLVLASCTSVSTTKTTTPINTLPPTTTVMTNTTTTTTIPPINDGTTPVQLEFTYDHLLTQKTISQKVEVKLPGSVILTLGSNPTTGFQWQDQATIGDNAVLSQFSHQFVQPTGDAVGAPGKDVYVFKTLAKGTSTIQLQYSRPWEGGEKGEWTVELTVVVSN